MRAKPGRISSAVSRGRSVLIFALVVTGVAVALGASAGVVAADGPTTWTHTIDGETQTATYEGAGTAADPYIIDSVVDLQAVNRNGTTRG